MNYSLETFNEASVGGWAAEERGVVGVVVQVKAAVTLPKAQPPPPLISPLLFTSLFLVPTLSSPLLLSWSFFFFFPPNLSFLSLPPSSFQMPDTAHVTSLCAPFFKSQKRKIKITKSQKEI